MIVAARAAKIAAESARRGVVTGRVGKGLRLAPPACCRGLLSVENMNPHIKKAQYAVRGEIVIRAGQHEDALARGGADAEALPFDEVVYCNIGNPQQLEQAPVTFPRQVLSLCSLPGLMDDERAKGLGMFPEDAVARARKYLDRIPGGTGAYSHSQGVHVVREEVAEFIDERDGTPAGSCDPDRIFLTDGASPAVQMLLRAMVSSPSDGVMIPIPQYPLYSAAIALCGGTQVPYYLDEESNWGTPARELEVAYDEARAQGVHPRAVAVINPGNPTGGVLDRDGVAGIVDFCRRRGLVLLADEVYQENVWAAGKEFHSFRRVALEEAAEGDAAGLQPLQLASFHSVSKGFFGECGRRGGYAQLQGFPDDVVAELYKLASISLCSNVEGQLMMGLMCRPPREGEASHPLYEQERRGLLDSLRRRADMLVRAFEGMDGVRCAPPEGALYAFPTIELPEGAVRAAAAAGKAPDAYYCLRLLDETGIVTVPGSGFGQREGTFHLRTTILPPEDKMDRVTRAMGTFHARFLEEHGE